MLRILIKAQLQSVLASLTRTSKGKRLSVAGAVLLMAFLAVIFLSFFGFTFYALALALPGMGLGWFYFALAAIMAFALGFIGSVFTAQQQLFAARDNELLLAMPIRPRDILGARMAVLLLLDYALTLIVLLPAGAVWLIVVGGTAGGVFGFVLSALLLPLLIMCFTCLFAWLLALISSRMRNKTVITLVLYLAFLAAYFYFYMNLQQLLTELIANSEQIAGAFVAVYPLYAFGQASLGSWLHIAGFAACCVIPFALVYAILSRGFLAVTTRRPSVKKLVYRERALKTSGVGAALLRKELGRFAANGMYILNAAMGSVLTVAAAAALIIYRDEAMQLLSVLPEGMGEGAVILALCFLNATDVISAPSISLESKTLWLLKSLPVPAWRILMAKVNLHLVIALPPTLIASACCCIALPFPPAGAAMVVLIPALTCVFGALLGVAVNLRYPKFDYINETAVIKNSMSVTVTLFGSWALLAAAALLYGLALHRVMGMTAYLYICAALLAALCAALYLSLRRSGARRFAEL